MTVLRNLPFPFGEPIAKQPRPNFKGADPQAGLMTRAWIDAFTALNNQFDATPVKASSVSLSDQGTGSAATDFTDGGVRGGQYRLSWFYKVTTASPTASTLQVDFDYTYRGITLTINGENLTGNLVTEACDDRNVAFIAIDGNTPVRYTVNYSTGAGAPMQYDLFVCLENVPL